MPRPPFIHSQGDLLLWVILVHHGFLLAQELIHEERRFESLRVVVQPKLFGIRRWRPAVWNRVPVKRDAVDVPRPGMFLPGFHYGFSPLSVWRAGTHGDLQHLVFTALREIHI